MTLEEETEYSTIHYRCIDPIENFKIKIILQPVKSLHILLPQFNVELSSDILTFPEENQSDVEEYTFKWQEKVFSRNEIKKYSSDHDWKKKVSETYHDNITEGLNDIRNYTTKVFSYVEADKFPLSEDDLNIFTERNGFVSSLSEKIKDSSINVQYIRNYKNISKRKIINYYPSEEFKKQTHLFNKNLQKMFIMLDLGSSDVQANKAEEQQEGLLVSLCYDHSNSVLQMTPQFSKSKLRPYTIGRKDGNGRNFYYYWVFHESSSIRSENLTKEMQLMSKVFDYSEEVKKLQLDMEFFVGKPDHIYMTVCGEIISARDFEYDNLHIHYFMKLPYGWGYSDIDSLIGRTQSCRKNSEGICNFSHLFEMNFYIDLNSLTDSFSTPLELFLEVLSVDKYKRFRSEGYTYVILPDNPGMQVYSLRCWRILNKSRTSQLERFFIGGGPELDDVSYVGLPKSENAEVMSRFGLETAPSGFIDVKLSILHQSVNFAQRDKRYESEKNSTSRIDAGSLLGSVNAVLEAFRRARERMLEAKKGLQTNLNS